MGEVGGAGGGGGGGWKISGTKAGVVFAFTLATAVL